MGLRHRPGAAEHLRPLCPLPSGLPSLSLNKSMPTASLGSRLGSTCSLCLQPPPTELALLFQTLHDPLVPSDTAHLWPQRPFVTWALLQSSLLLLPLPLAPITSPPSPPRLSFHLHPPSSPRRHRPLRCWACPASSSGRVPVPLRPQDGPRAGLCGHHWILGPPTGLPQHLLGDSSGDWARTPRASLF